MRYSLFLLPLLSLAMSAQVTPPAPAPAVAAPVTVAVAPRPLPLNQLLNLYVTQFAYEHVEYQRDIRMEGTRARALDSATTLPGRYIGQSTYFGYYTYVPASYHDLSKIQQNAILGSAQFKAWLEWFGTKTRVMSLVDTPAYPQPKILPTPDALVPDFGRYNYTISVDEMLSLQPLQLKLRQ